MEWRQGTERKGWRVVLGLEVEQESYQGRRRALDVFTVIGDPTKRRLLEMTREREWCVNEMVEYLEISQPAISKHLRSLREAGLVDVRVDGQRRWYRLRNDQMTPLLDWTGNFSGIQPE
jgi:DNA-binding transcriptional ArsR family regulator